MNHYAVRNFKVVEINNLVALRSGHIIAQAAMAKAKYLDGAQDFVQNGDILFLDVDGALKTRNQLNSTDTKNYLQPILHYTEELLTGPVTDLKYFAVEWEAGNICYPRGLVLNVGDTFTTDNYVMASAVNFADGAYATINSAGKIEVNSALPTGAYEGPLFKAVPSTLPDAVTNAFEFTVIALNAVFVL